MSSEKEPLPPTIFSNLPVQFLDVSSTQKLKTQEFLAASAGVVTIIEKFGKVFAPVIHDMNGNIQKLTYKYNEDKENNEFLEEMILKQKNAGDLITVDALQWLRRALNFMCRFFQFVIEDADANNNTQDLSPFIKMAYKETLERYHGWIGSQLFNILSRFVPNRQHLFYHLALEKHNLEDHVIGDMKLFNEKLARCIQRLVDFYQEHNLETTNRV